MKKFWAFIVMLVIAFGAYAQQLQWRETTKEWPGKSITDPRLTDGVEIYGRNGVIMVRTQRKIQVRVFTILGQLVSQATLNAGTSELKMNSRGVYILRIGNITQKIAL